MRNLTTEPGYLSPSGSRIFDKRLIDNPMNSAKYIYRCCCCGKEYGGSSDIYLCPSCSKLNQPENPPKGVLKVIYDYDSICRNIAQLAGNGYIDLLPIRSLSSLPQLKVGKTPLYQYSRMEGKNLPFTLLLKDDSQNPTFSFKDRASALVSAYALENGKNEIVTASTGNAGSSLAGICASQGQKAIIMVPKNAPAAKLTQIVMYGASIVPVDGSYDQAFDLSVKSSETFGWYNRNTAFNPLTIEGKKTVSFEIFEQLKGQLPDRIFVPVGDGVIISGVYKGFEDLLMLKLIDRMPTIVAVQAKGSSNLVSNLFTDVFCSQTSQTLADSISVDIPRNFYMARQYIKTYNGETVTVTDGEILEASAILARNTGLFAEPAASAALAGLISFFRQNKVEGNTSNMVLLTGSGLKDLKAVSPIVQFPKAIKPKIDALKELVDTWK